MNILFKKIFITGLFTLSLFVASQVDAQHISNNSCILSQNHQTCDWYSDNDLTNSIDSTIFSNIHGDYAFTGIVDLYAGIHNPGDDSLYMYAITGSSSPGTAENSSYYLGVEGGSSTTSHWDNILYELPDNTGESIDEMRLLKYSLDDWGVPYDGLNITLGFRAGFYTLPKFNTVFISTHDFLADEFTGMDAVGVEEFFYNHALEPNPNYFSISPLPTEIQKGDVLDLTITATDAAYENEIDIYIGDFYVTTTSMIAGSAMASVPINFSTALDVPIIARSGSLSGQTESLFSRYYSDELYTQDQSCLLSQNYQVCDWYSDHELLTPVDLTILNNIHGDYAFTGTIDLYSQIDNTTNDPLYMYAITGSDSPAAAENSRYSLRNPDGVGGTSAAWSNVLKELPDNVGESIDQLRLLKYSLDDWGVPYDIHNLRIGFEAGFYTLPKFNTVFISTYDFVIDDFIGMDGKEVELLFYQHAAAVDPDFFTFLDLPEYIEKDQEISFNIHAEDPSYTGSVSLFYDGVYQQTLIVTDGVVAVDMIFSEALTTTSLQVVAENLLQGSTTAFTVHEIPVDDFFTFTHNTEIVENTDSLTVNITTPSDVSYTNITSCIINDDLETTQSVIFTDGAATMDITTSTYPRATYTIICTDEHLSGTSSFTIIKKSSSGSSVSTGFSNFFNNLFGGDDGTEEDNQEEETEEQEPELEEEEEPNNNNEETEEDSEPKEEEVNACLDLKRSDLVLRKGNKGNKVRILQNYLDTKNYKLGVIDGDFGNNTKQTLIQFQTDNNLAADGVFGNQSYTYLDLHCDSIQNKVDVVIEVEVEEEIQDTTTPPLVIEEKDFGDHILDIAHSISDWFSDIFSGWFGGNNSNNDIVLDDGVEEEIADEAKAEGAIKVYTDGQGREVIEVLDRVMLEELVEKVALQLPPKDLNLEEEKEDELPDDVLSGKILDVPYIPQSLYKKNGEWNGNYRAADGGTAVPALGYTMCSGASVAMIAAYYGKIPYDKTAVTLIDSYPVNTDLREFVWKDKGMNLGWSCDVKSEYSPYKYSEFSNGEVVSGAFATTSDYRLYNEGNPELAWYKKNKLCNQGAGQTAYDNYFKKIGLGETKLLNSFDEVKQSIDNDQPVMFSESGHLMVAKGYLDFPQDQKETKLKLESGGTITAQKKFYLVVNDPKRNRNRTKIVEGLNKAYSVDGSSSVYLVVYREKDDNEYMCRASNSDRYTCTPFNRAYQFK